MILLRSCYHLPAGKALAARFASSSACQRSFMSTQPVMAPEDESTLMLILGKPGGGKGTISGKILEVSYFFVSVSSKKNIRLHPIVLISDIL